MPATLVVDRAGQIVYVRTSREKVFQAPAIEPLDTAASSFANTSRMVLTCPGWACAQAADGHSSAAAIAMS